MKMKISHEVRLLVKHPPAIDLLKLIAQSVRDSERHYRISPKETNSLLADAFSNKKLWEENKTLYDEVVDACYKNKELLLLNALADDGAITWSNQCEDGYVSAMIVIKDPQYIIALETWVSQQHQITEYGDFMVNHLSSIGYCLDKYHQFTPHSGIYKLFKLFIMTNNHFVSHEDIIHTYENRVLHQEEKKDLYERSRPFVNEIKKTFAMSPNSGYFVANDQGYLLNPHRSI